MLSMLLQGVKITIVMTSTWISQIYASLCVVSCCCIL
uniref:Uncharacterized protein n=1 Tax=Anguilla anguilla TaxID=7936 RepID=A0A0E9T760_ANGAN